MNVGKMSISGINFKEEDASQAKELKDQACYTV